MEETQIMQVATLPYYAYPAFSMCHEDRILGVLTEGRSLGRLKGKMRSLGP